MSGKEIVEPLMCDISESFKVNLLASQASAPWSAEWHSADNPKIVGVQSPYEPFTSEVDLMILNAHELEPIDTEKSQNISQGAVKDRQICMSSANTTDDRDPKYKPKVIPMPGIFMDLLNTYENVLVGDLKML
ncbi:hypothetical protein TURU_099339 [Turdus rufiventris]|nr:hypothetical protein TURU_099339 [Turdus rufiventris]